MNESGEITKPHYKQPDISWNSIKKCPILNVKIKKRQKIKESDAVQFYLRKTQKNIQISLTINMKPP